LNLSIAVVGEIGSDVLLNESYMRQLALPNVARDGNEGIKNQSG